MSELCDCPPGVMSVIPDTGCEKNMNIVRKMAFCYQRDFQGVTSPPTVSTLAELAEWATTLAAVDNTLTVITPLLDNVKLTAGDFKTSTFSQKELKNGRNATLVEAVIIGATAAQIKAIKEVGCQKKLYVYFFNEDNQCIHALRSTTVPGGFEVVYRSFGIKDTDTDGTSPDPDTNMITFLLKEGWSEEKEITTLAFDPLTELANGGS